MEWSLDPHELSRQIRMRGEKASKSAQVRGCNFRGRYLLTHWRSDSQSGWPRWIFLTSMQSSHSLLNTRKSKAVRWHSAYEDSWLTPFPCKSRTLLVDSTAVATSPWSARNKEFTHVTLLLNKTKVTRMCGQLPKVTAKREYCGLMATCTRIVCQFKQCWAPNWRIRVNSVDNEK